MVKGVECTATVDGELKAGCPLNGEHVRFTFLYGAVIDDAVQASGFTEFGGSAQNSTLFAPGVVSTLNLFAATSD